MSARHESLMHSRLRLQGRRERALARREADVDRWGKLVSVAEAEGVTAAKDMWTRKLERAKADVANLKRKLKLQ